MTAEPLRLLFHDEHLAVCDKPSGLAVHRGWAPERDVAMRRVRDALGARVFPVHRLDRGTSGVLVFARTAAAAAALGRAFADGSVEKRYLALVRGVPPEAVVIDHAVPAGEDSEERVAAVTAIARLEVFLERYSLVEARPRTGRLHQVRRHLKHISCPLIGDVKYGKGEHNRLFRERYDLHRLFLHAATIAFPHPATGERVEFEAPLAAELARCLEALRGGRSGAVGPDGPSP